MCCFIARELCLYSFEILGLGRVRTRNLHLGYWIMRHQSPKQTMLGCAIHCATAPTLKKVGLWRAFITAGHCYIDSVSDGKHLITRLLIHIGLCVSACFLWRKGWGLKSLSMHLLYYSHRTLLIQLWNSWPREGSNPEFALWLLTQAAPIA